MLVNLIYLKFTDEEIEVFSNSDGNLMLPQIESFDACIGAEETVGDGKTIGPEEEKKEAVASAYNQI